MTCPILARQDPFGRCSIGTDRKCFKAYCPCGPHKTVHLPVHLCARPGRTTTNVTGRVDSVHPF